LRGNQRRKNRTQSKNFDPASRGTLRNLRGSIKLEDRPLFPVFKRKNKEKNDGSTPSRWVLKKGKRGKKTG